MKNKIASLDESAKLCDLSDEQLSQYDIRTVALRVATSQGEFRDRLEITQEQLYDLLQREVPKTSLPLPEDVSNLYRTLHDEGATSILHLSISGSLSGTFNMVSLLAEDFEDMKIHVFDSKTLSCGLGLLVLEAAESLQEGAIGSLLQIKPVIYVNDEGVYNTLCKARGFSNALTAMVDEIIRRYQGHKVRLAVVHGAAYDDAVKLRDRLMERLDVVSSFISPVSPALAIHTGPGLLGAIVQLAE